MFLIHHDDAGTEPGGDPIRRIEVDVAEPRRLVGHLAAGDVGAGIDGRPNSRLFIDIVTEMPGIGRLQL